MKDPKTEPLKIVKIAGSDYPMTQVSKMEEKDGKTVIYWQTKAGQKKKTTVRNDQIISVDEDVEEDVE